MLLSSSYLKKQNVAVEWFEFLFRIWEVSSSNLDSQTDNRDWDAASFHVVSISLHINHPIIRRCTIHATDSVVK
jgi:hypothetical protein